MDALDPAQLDVARGRRPADEGQGTGGVEPREPLGHRLHDARRATTQTCTSGTRVIIRRPHSGDPSRTIVPVSDDRATDPVTTASTRSRSRAVALPSSRRHPGPRRRPRVGHARGGDEEAGADGRESAGDRGTDGLVVRRGARRRWRGSPRAGRRAARRPGADPAACSPVAPVGAGDVGRRRARRRARRGSGPAPRRGRSRALPAGARPPVAEVSAGGLGASREAVHPFRGGGSGRTGRPAVCRVARSWLRARPARSASRRPSPTRRRPWRRPPARAAGGGGVGLGVLGAQLDEQVGDVDLDGAHVVAGPAQARGVGQRVVRVVAAGHAGQEAASAPRRSGPG